MHKNFDKKIGYALFTTLLVGALVGVVVTNSGNGQLNLEAESATCEHANVEEYEEVAATSSSHGHVHHYACCECHTAWSDSEHTVIIGNTQTDRSNIDLHYLGEEEDSSKVIGYKVKKCQIPNCEHEEDTETLMTEIPQMKIGMFGSNGTNINKTADAFGAEIDALMFGAATSPSIILPKVNYSLYSSVLFSIGADHWNSDSLSISYQIGEQTLADWSFVKGTKQFLLTVSASGSDLTVKIAKLVSTSAENSVVISDAADIINGSQSLVIKQNAVNRTTYLNGITLAAPFNKYLANDITNDSSSGTTVTKVNDTIGGVTGSFVKAHLNASSGSYTRTKLLYANNTLKPEISMISFRLYIACTDTEETKTTIMLWEAANRGWPDGCIKTIDVPHNTWATLSFPADRMAIDGVFNSIWFYGNGAKAERDYYVEWISVYDKPSVTYKTLAGRNVFDVANNNCKGGSNLGSHFASAKLSAPGNNCGYEGYATSLNIGTYNTYLLDRINLFVPVYTSMYNKVTFKVYLKTAGEVTVDTPLILCPDLSTSGSQQVKITAANANKWVDITFTNLANAANNGVLDHINFGIWGTDGGTTGDSLLVASMTFSA